MIEALALAAVRNASIMLCWVVMMCMWEGLICFGAQLVGLVERREIKLFRIFWLRAVLDQFIFGKTHT